MRRHDDVFAMDEIRGEIRFVFGFVDIEIAELPEDDDRMVRNEEPENIAYMTWGLARCSC